MAGWSTYSETFVRAFVPGGWTSYTVPSGMRAVVRSFVYLNNAVDPATVYLRINGHLVWFDASQAPRSSRSIDLRAVAYNGWHIDAYVNPAEVYATVSGFLFHDAQGAQGAPGDIAWTQDLHPGQLPLERP